MIFNSIIKDYFEKNKFNVIFYILICSIDNIVRVLVTSRIYSSFLNKDVNLTQTINKVILLWIFKFLLSYSKSYLESIIIPDVFFFMRNRLVNDYIKTNEISFNDVDISSDFRQIMDATKYLKDIIVWMVESVVPTVVLMFFMNAYFLIKYPKVGTINIIGNIASLFVIRNSYEDILEKSIEREEIFMKMIDHIDENLNNMMNIFLNNKSDDTIQKITKIGKIDMEHYRKQYSNLEDFSTNVKLTNYLFTGIGLYVLYKTTNREDFVNGLLIYTFFIQTQETIIEEIPKYIMILSNIKHIEQYLERKVYDRLKAINNKTLKYRNNINDFKGNITFKNVYFKYEMLNVTYDNDLNKKEKVSEPSNVINNLNLSIQAGERVAMYAKSGSGKSTLMKLLLAFYFPQTGNIYLDGKDTQTINPLEIREKINYINQKTILFQDTILNNLRYGNNKSEKEVIQFLKKYNLLNIFRDCDKEENTCLNNMIQLSGLNMSMGMQKVIFLVRGILKESEVYIFDEPLTSLDTKTRENVIHMIDVETKGKTVIIITHDTEINNIVDRQVNLLDIQNNTKEDSKL